MFLGLLSVHLCVWLIVRWLATLVGANEKISQPKRAESYPEPTARRRSSSTRYKTKTWLVAQTVCHSQYEWFSSHQVNIFNQHSSTFVSVKIQIFLRFFSQKNLKTNETAKNKWLARLHWLLVVFHQCRAWIKIESWEKHINHSNYRRRRIDSYRRRCRAPSAFTKWAINRSIQLWLANLPFLPSKTYWHRVSRARHYRRLWIAGPWWWPITHRRRKATISFHRLPWPRPTWSSNNYNTISRIYFPSSDIITSITTSINTSCHSVWAIHPLTATPI